MTKRITLNTFRKVAKAEESMIRAAMPKTSASDPEPIPFYANARPTAKRTFTFKLGDVAKMAVADVR